MSVLVVLVHAHLITGHLRAALRVHRLTLGVLLGDKSLYFQLAELQRRLHAKQRLRSAYQTRVQIHRHVSGLDGLNNVVFLSFVL